MFQVPVNCSAKEARSKYTAVSHQRSSRSWQRNISMVQGIHLICWIMWTIQAVNCNYWTRFLWSWSQIWYDCNGNRLSLPQLFWIDVQSCLPLPWQFHVIAFSRADHSWFWPLTSILWSQMCHEVIVNISLRTHDFIGWLNNDMVQFLLLTVPLMASERSWWALY